VPFRLHRRHPDLAAAERRRIAVPLARVEERLATLGSDLDTLAADVSDVALRMRQMAAQVTSRTGGVGDE
jgi:ABC-type phosphate transport system auxiliary subunit